jgi:site-specific recombinase XerD
MVNLSKPWARVQRAVRLASKGKVNIDDVNLHILRHTFASFGVSDGVAIAMVGSLLGHKNPSTTQRYAHLLTDPRQQASTKISEAIKDALG